MSQAALFQSTPQQRFATRYYQEDALAAVQAGIASGEHSQLVMMATGLGKTVVFAHLIQRAPGPVLVVAHREELIEQAARTIEALTGEVVEIEQAANESWKARIVVGSVQSLRRESRLQRIGRGRFSLIVLDECFPAGTLVDGRPIETIRVGDHVWCVDHASGELARRIVLRTFVRTCRDALVQLTYGATELTCTAHHPVFAKGKGHVRAEEIIVGDLLCVRHRYPETGLSEPTSAHVRNEIVSSGALVGDYGEDQHGSRVGSHVAQQSHETPGDPSEDVRHTSCEQASTAGEGRQRDRGDQGGTGNRRGDGHADADHCPSREGAWARMADPLQDRCRVRGAEGGHRGRRGEPCGPVEASAGREEGCLLAWVRVDRVTRDQSPGTDGTRVYNLEVEGAHTYFANDALVHNCHHATAASYRTVMDFFDCPVVGVTATPDRGDEKALGQVFDRVSFSMDIQDGIEQGWLVPFQGHRVVLDSIKLDLVGVTAEDLQQGELDEAMVQSVEGIAHETAKLSDGRQSIAFFPGVRSAELAARSYEKRGIAACVVSGGTPKDERRRLISDFRRGVYRVLCNCQLVTEGADFPEVSCIIQGRPTLSRALYTQMIGRGSRVLPGVVDRFPDRGADAIRRAAIAQSWKKECLIIDCVGNSVRHSLIGPEDALGGNFDAEVVAEAKRKAKAGQDPLRALREAKEMLRAIAAKAKVDVKATHSRFDPFAVLGVAYSEEDRFAQRFGLKPVTEGQRAALDKMGMIAKDLEGLSKRAASKLIDEMVNRRQRGLATFKQVRALEKFGVVDARTASMPRAGQALDYIAGLGWGRRAIDPNKLQSILFGERESGED